MSKLSRTLATLLGQTANLHPRETLIQTGNLGALNAEVILECDGASTFGVEFRGTFSLTANLQGSLDGTNWIQIPFRILVPGATTGYIFSVALTTTVQLVARAAPWRFIKVVAAAYTSGAATVTLLSHNGILDDTLVEGVSSLHVGATAAVSTAVTVTLPAVVGLRHYITGFSYSRFAPATLTPGAAPFIITTTNLAGSRTYNLPADGLVGGSIDRYREEYAKPLQTSQTNTATTFVCPIVTGAIMKLHVDYYLGQ